MDLKDVVGNVNLKAAQAHSAYHAGHRDKAEDHLREIRGAIAVYFEMGGAPVGDVTESATSSPDAGPPEEKPAEVQDAPDQQVPESPVLPASQFGSDRSVVKPNQ